MRENARRRHVLLLVAALSATVSLRPAAARSVAPPRQPAHADRWDLLIRGGRIIDPANDRDSVADVAVRDGKIDTIGVGLDPGGAQRVVDARGLLVTPGLVDIHVHVYASRGDQASPRRRRRPAEAAVRGGLSVEVDPHALPSGVTTVVDAGSAGCSNFADFKARVIDPSRTRVLAMLNISRDGMAGVSSESSLGKLDAECVVRLATQFPELIVGIKVGHVTRSDMEAINRAWSAAARAGLPVVVHLGGNGPPGRRYGEILGALRPGDMVTHIYDERVPLTRRRGGVVAIGTDWLQARRRGVLFDLGFGSRGFSWQRAEDAKKLGFSPDFVSTDLAEKGVRTGRPPLSMATVIDRMHTLGYSLTELVRMATVKPADAIRRRDLGRLSINGRADLAIWRLETTSHYHLVDSRGQVRSSTSRLNCVQVFRDGLQAWEANAK